MTLVRRLAVRVTCLVARFASAGSREWAQGLAREVDVIEGDWKALGWALGGLRVLAARREAPLATLEQVPAATRRLRSDVSRGAIAGAGIAVVECAAFSFYFVEFHATMMRVGSALTAAAAIWFAYRMLVQRVRWTDCGDALGRTYRAELERQRNFHKLGQLLLLQTPMLVGVLVFCVGMGANHPETARMMAGIYLTILAFASLAARNYRRKAASYRRKIAELDELLKTAN